ncbi:hypothetical protein MSAN_01142500 [Mycena sanguinolenta]|uniref:Uncharacterized protein n=1 Tax=Mycena sanguinolenta TaxID=230812 RepID=A0A8H6YLA4_9AGAR|nr:hypothetical protein MSAN_01142500 [Mycena sanguinolenta]
MHVLFSVHHREQSQGHRHRPSQIVDQNQITASQDSRARQHGARASFGRRAAGWDNPDIETLGRGSDAGYGPATAAVCRRVPGREGKREGDSEVCGAPVAPLVLSPDNRQIKCPHSLVYDGRGERTRVRHFHPDLPLRSSASRHPRAFSGPCERDEVCAGNPDWYSGRRIQTRIAKWFGGRKSQADEGQSIYYGPGSSHSFFSVSPV